jgi:hypothetical protein
MPGTQRSRRRAGGYGPYRVGRLLSDDDEDRQGKALPFEPLVPNEETIEAMKAARRGELVTVGPPRKLLASLNADS